MKCVGSFLTDLVHQSCLEKVVSELPADTARAGLVCPQCQKPVVPSSTELAGSPLASALVSQLRDLPWAAAFLAAALPATPSAPTPEPAPEPAAPPATTTEEDTPAAPAESPIVTPTTTPEPASKPSASALFVQATPAAHSSSTTDALTAPPAVSPHVHAPAHARTRAPVPTGIPGVGLFVPPPPPSSSSSSSPSSLPGVVPTESIPITGPVLSNLPLTDVVDAPDDEAAGADGFSIQIPPPGSRLAARKANALGGTRGTRRDYEDDDDDDDKYESKTLMFLLSVLGLTKRVRGRVVVDRTKALVAGVVVLVVVIFLARLVALARTPAPAADTPAAHEPLGPPLEDQEQPQ